MVEKSNKSEPYVKATITAELNNSLKAIEKKLDISRANIVRGSLYEYIKTHYSELMPKSKSEIMKDVKEKFYFEKYSQEFRTQEYLKNQIPVYENYKKELTDRIDTAKKEVEHNKIKNTE